MIEVMDLREVDESQALFWLSDLAENLRTSDLDEIEATSELSPFEALLGSVQVSARAWVVLLGDQPVAAFGAAHSAHPQTGIVWMLGTPGMDKAGLSILRATRAYLQELHQLWPVLWNHIDARNAKSMAYLRWAGFKVLEVLPEHGRQGRPFFTFARYEPYVPSHGPRRPSGDDHRRQRL